MTRAGLRDSHVRIAEEELEEAEKNGGVKLHGFTLQEMFHKNKLEDVNLRYLHFNLLRQEKEFKKKIDSSERKFLTIQVCRKDINPYIVPPVTKSRPKRIGRKSRFSTDNNSNFLMPKKLKDDHIQFSVSQKLPICPLVSNSLPELSEAGHTDIIVESFSENNNLENDTAQSDKKVEYLSTSNIPDEQKPTSASEIFEPQTLNRDTTRLEFKELKAKFNSLKMNMKTKAPYLMPMTEMSINERQKGPFPGRITTTPKVDQKIPHPQPRRLKPLTRHNKVDILTVGHGSSKCKCQDLSPCPPHDHESFNKYIDKMSLQLSPIATEKLNKFKDLITDTESTESFKNRLLEMNRKLNVKPAIKDHRWLDFMEVMNRKPIILKKYRKEEPAKKPVEKYDNKLRFFSSVNWMG